ncbi:LPXTG cell wall anchor domain-containing protein [Streptomyces sp. NPDC048718]|uniref:LPXTG cell wall anchor domain-containing protein n=1 Tax=Streptomyces sp. NPDC048718 TaxID=3365587 RepID=UPI00371A0BC1
MRRILISAATVVSSVTAASLLLAPVASATGKAKGDNGTVKIHDAKTGEELMQNEPHVCAFYLDGFKFDAAQKVSWSIKGQAPTKDLQGTSGSLTMDASGHGRTDDLKLPNGHYKLTWNFAGENGNGKHKAFWVDCEDTEPGEPGTPVEPTPGETPGTPSETPSTPGETPGTPSETPSTPGETPGTPGETPGTPGETPGTPGTPGETAGTPSPSATTPATGSTGGDNGTGSTGGENGSTEGDLAQTGSSAPVGIIAGVAVVLAAAGAFLVSRRRKAQQG